MDFHNYSNNFVVKTATGQPSVAHGCNPSYSEGRDQEDHGLKPAWANFSVRPYLEKPTTKKG
jgi:hypothetical protein